jgi:ribosomal protein S18 acetylase RimI-like enzyme
MAVEEVSPSDRATVRRAARLEREVLAREPHFVPETDRDAVRRLSGQSLLLLDAEFQLFIGRDESSRLVARALVTIQPLWQQVHDAPRTGFLGDLVVTPGAEDVALDVIRRGEQWLADRGIVRVCAPQSHYLAQFVLRTGARDEDPTMPLRWDAPEVEQVLLAAGYKPTRPAWIYRIDLRSDAWRPTAERALEHPAGRVRPLDKRHWDREIATVTDVVNRTFDRQWAFQPGSTEVMLEVLAPLKRIAAPWHNLLAEVDGEVAGVCLTIPSYTLPMRRVNGRSGPLATLRFVREARKQKVAAIYLVAVLPEHRGRGIERTLLATVLRSYATAGFHTADYLAFNDENRDSRPLAEAFGGHGRVLYHGFERWLDERAEAEGAG